jgi:hypothetical protein
MKYHPRIQIVEGVHHKSVFDNMAIRVLYFEVPPIGLFNVMLLQFPLYKEAHYGL